MEHVELLKALRDTHEPEDAQRIIAGMLEEAGKTGLPPDQCVIVVRATLEHEIWNRFPDYDWPRLAELFLQPMQNNFTPITRQS